MNNNDWQHYALQDLLVESLKEQRRKRRWGIFFKFIFILFVLIFLGFLYENNSTQIVSREKPHVALIDIDGPIVNGGLVDADNVATSLNQAFKDKGTKGIILRINSPGGSPVQSDYIYTEIIRLKKAHPETKVYAVCTDICASGAYFIASAADQIYANPASLVGSIGVIMDGFGFVDSLKKLGMTRRVFTSGSEKAFLDPFSPLNPKSVEKLQTILDDVHQQFIAAVKNGRGTRLKNDSDIFTGLIWTGNQAKQLGLVDGFGSAGWVARNVIKEERIVDYTIKPSYLDQLASTIGASAGEQLTKSLGIHQTATLK